MLDRGTLRGLRDRAMLLVGFAGGLRRSETAGLDLVRDQTEDGRGWIEILDKGAPVTLRGKTGWREVEIGRGSSEASCPVAAIESWIRFAKIAGRLCSAASPARQECRGGPPRRPGGGPPRQ